MEAAFLTTVLSDRTEEHTLASAAIAGDQDAIESIWQLHRHWVAAVLLAHKPREEDLEDLLQEVAATLVSKIAMVRNALHLRAWLRTVAINAARAAARTRKSRPQLRLVGSDYNVDHAADPEWDDRAVRDEECRRMLALVSRLPDDYREPLLLRAMHGMRSRQISEILEVPEATIDTRISRARRMLREQALARDEEENQRTARGS